MRWRGKLPRGPLVPHCNKYKNHQTNFMLHTPSSPLHTFPMRVKKLLHTRMRVNEIEKTVKFYTDVLGLEIEARRESPRDAKLVFLRTPGSEELLEITYFPDSGPVMVQPDLMHLAFEVDDLAAYTKYLESKGIKLTDGPTESKSTGSVFAFIDAPEGYEIELIQRPKA